MTDKSDILLSLKHAARCLGVSKITIRRWTDLGILRCVRIGARRDREFRLEGLDEMREQKDRGTSDARGLPLPGNEISIVTAVIWSIGLQTS